MIQLDKIIQKLDEAINTPSNESNRKILIEIREELIHARNEKQVLKSLLKLVELLGIFAKAYFGSS